MKHYVNMKFIIIIKMIIFKKFKQLNKKVKKDFSKFILLFYLKIDFMIINFFKLVFYTFYFK